MSGYYPLPSGGAGSGSSQQPYRPNYAPTPQYTANGNPVPQSQPVSQYRQPSRQPTPQYPASYAGTYPQQPGNGSDVSSPSSQSSADSAPKERTWTCVKPGCMTADRRLVQFSRKADLQRHIGRKHIPSPQLYDCDVPGCDRVGLKGLPRLDKLTDHKREKHGCNIPKMARNRSQQSV